VDNYVVYTNSTYISLFNHTGISSIIMLVAPNDDLNRCNDLCFGINFPPSMVFSPASFSTSSQSSVQASKLVGSGVSLRSLLGSSDLK